MCAPIIISEVQKEMKMITRRGVFLWILTVLFVAGLAFMGYSLVEDGDV